VNFDRLDLGSAAQQWQIHGFAVLPGFLPADELKSALDELPKMFPTADGFHDGTDKRRERFVGDEFAGIDTFPFRSTELSLLSVSDRLTGLAERFLGETDLRIYSAEAWAKYTGAADYDQSLHRDYLLHTLVVPTDDPRFRQLELFVYLVDVPEELGATRLLSRTRTPHLPARPNWYPRADTSDSEGGWVATAGRLELYEAEVRAAGPAGTVFAWAPGTFHRGTQLSLPRGARYTMHLSYRPAAARAVRLPAARPPVLDARHLHRRGWSPVAGPPSWGGSAGIQQPGWPLLLQEAWCLRNLMKVLDTAIRNFAAKGASCRVRRGAG
jgi:hypothetical protein